jgi:hypothetical protein
MIVDLRHSGKIAFDALSSAANAILSGIPFGGLPQENQMGFRINFLSLCEEKILRNDAFFCVGCAQYV